MGYMRHHAIWVTSWDEKLIQEAHSKASEIFDWVSPISPPAMNGYTSFYIPPDGSKEGWPDSDEGDKRRNAFIGWLENTSLDWVEVQYGDGDGVTVITRHSER